LLSDLTAGIVTGLISVTAEVVNAIGAGIVSVVIGLMISVPFHLHHVHHAAYPFWFTWGGFFLTVPALAMGGGISKLFHHPAAQAASKIGIE
jgi:hypothetical protein